MKDELVELRLFRDHDCACEAWITPDRKGYAARVIAPFEHPKAGSHVSARIFADVDEATEWCRRTASELYAITKALRDAAWSAQFEAEAKP